MSQKSVWDSGFLHTDKNLLMGVLWEREEGRCHPDEGKSPSSTKKVAIHQTQYKNSRTIRTFQRRYWKRPKIDEMTDKKKIKIC